MVFPSRKPAAGTYSPLVLLLQNGRPRPATLLVTSANANSLWVRNTIRGGLWISLAGLVTGNGTHLGNWVNHAHAGLHCGHSEYQLKDHISVGIVRGLLGNVIHPQTVKSDIGQVVGDRGGRVEIADCQFSHFAANMDWCILQAAAGAGGAAAGFNRGLAPKGQTAIGDSSALEGNIKPEPKCYP